MAFQSLLDRWSVDLCRVDAEARVGIALLVDALQETEDALASAERDNDALRCELERQRRPPCPPPLDAMPDGGDGSVGGETPRIDPVSPDVHAALAALTLRDAAPPGAPPGTPAPAHHGPQRR